MRETPVTVVGTLVSDARPRRVGPDGTLVLNFRVASNERRYDKGSESWVDGESLYLSVNCWRRLAENAASLVKGDPVIVNGRLRTREWTTEHGERRSVTELDATAVGPDLARCAATVRKPRREEPRWSGEQADMASGEQTHPERENAGRDDETSLPDLADAARPLVTASA
jgi:single-strand DNA-binding protein